MNPSRFCVATLCLVPTALFLTVAESRAWGTEGHMIVALVADRLVQAKDGPTQKKLAELLASDKSNSWTKTDIAGGDLGGRAAREKPGGARCDNEVALREARLYQSGPDQGVFRQTCFAVDGTGEPRAAGRLHRR